MYLGSRLFGTTFKCNKTQRRKYDVFLSFTGETRKGFTHFLYKALQRRGLKVFRDQELERGTNISSNLFAAIEESRFAIVVLSPKYASSTWCSDELTKIMECVEVKGTTILPILSRRVYCIKEVLLQKPLTSMILIMLTTEPKCKGGEVLLQH
ncbi:hypothetical protein ACLB2K_001632 [Fragaria x ananassa]